MDGDSRLSLGILSSLYKFGLTFYMYRHLALNLEYRYVKYKTYDVPGFDLTYKNEYAGYALMLSFPFEI